jgi:hypothetical protein
MSGYVEKTITIGRPEALISDLRLEVSLRGVLHKYQSIKGRREALWLRACAEEAFVACKSAGSVPSDMVLTEWGVTFQAQAADGVLRVQREVYQYNDRVRESTAHEDEQRVQVVVEQEKHKASERVAVATAAFLTEWERLCNATQKKKEAAEARDRQVVAEMTAAVNSNPNLFQTPRVVASVLESDGFHLRDAGALRRPNSEVMGRGLVLIADHSDGRERKVTLMPDGSMVTHVENPDVDVDLNSCKREAGALANRIGEAIANAAEIAGADLALSTTRTGFGQGTEGGQSQQNETLAQAQLLFAAGAQKAIQSIRSV